MKQTILSLAVVLILLLHLPSFAETSETETLIPIADTYVDVQAINSTFGQMDFLQVSDYASEFSIVALMFDISRINEAPSEAKLRLYCFDIGSRHVVGVHWCVNNTWNEENLAFILLGKFFKTNPEDAIIINSKDAWYEWKVTDFINEALEENYEKISLTLEVEDPLGGMALSRFASKDQPWQEYSPRLVFTYLNSESETDPLDIPVKVAIGLAATVTIVFLGIRFSKRHTKKKRRKPRKV